MSEVTFSTFYSTRAEKQFLKDALLALVFDKSFFLVNQVCFCYFPLYSSLPKSLQILLYEFVFLRSLPFVKI